MAIQSSLICSFPQEVLALVAFHLSTHHPIGPPSQLLPLLSTCSHFYFSLAPHNAQPLYAAIFEHRFDSRASVRRLGERTKRPTYQTLQLKKVSRMLGRVKQGDVRSSHLEADFWTAFLMCLENDGRNAVQLDHAGLDALVIDYLRTRLYEGRESTSGWPAESTLNALALWLFWFRLTDARLAAMHVDQRNEISDLVRPYVLTALRYPIFHAPDNHFELPLPEQLREQPPWLLTTPHGFYPLYRDPDALAEHLAHFAMPLTLAAPLIALGAQLIYTALHETPLPYSPGQPENRAHSLQLNRHYIHPTRADVDEANAKPSVVLPSRGDWDWYAGLSAEQRVIEDGRTMRPDLTSASAKWDRDFARLVFCFDPYNYPSLKPSMWTHGTLTGLWRGRLLVPEVTGYFNLIHSQEFPPTFAYDHPRLFTSPLYMNLREHHCVNPEAPAASGGEPEGFDDGICNAWFPVDTTFYEEREKGELRVVHTDSGTDSCYTTWVPGRPNGHSEDTCTLCERRREDHEMEVVARARIFARTAEHVGAAQETANEEESEERSREEVASDPPSPPEDPMDQVVAARQAATEALGTDADEVLREVFEESSDEDMDSEEDEYASTNEDDVEEYIEAECTGVSDIVITGETLQRHGEAWNHYRFYGRVREWDGLIALVRVPMFERDLGTYIFRGYIIGGTNFVGRWRAWTKTLDRVPLEGPFTMTRALAA